MIELLLTPEIFIDALQSNNQDAQKLLDYCASQDTIKTWVLSNLAERLHEAGIATDQIKSTLTAHTQISLNAKINEDALALTPKVSLREAFHQIAAKTFKLHAIVSNQGYAEGEVKRIGYSDVEQLKEEEVVGEHIRFLDLGAPLHAINDSVEKSFTEIIVNTAFVSGKYVKAFEEDFARYCGVKHAIGVNSGTDALRFALTALGIGAGDEVITVPNTFIATTEAISQVGAVPVFVDVLPDTYNMNPELIEAKITAKTKAILPVHLYGQIADMDPIMAIAKKHNLKVLEDACQAHGARYNGKRAGTFGHAAAFSMYPGKNLGAFGEAGAIVTNDDDVANTAACLRDHGQDKKYYHRMEGYNGRMDNFQGAALFAKLPYLDQWNEQRRKNAALYTELLAGIPEIQLPVIPPNSEPVFHLYVILTENPTGLQEYLKENQIDSAFHYPIPLHLQAAYSAKMEGKGSYPVTERCAERLLSLPMYPELTEFQIRRVAGTIQKFFAK